MVDNFGLTSSFHNFSYTVDLMLIFFGQRMLTKRWPIVDHKKICWIFYYLSQIFKVFQNEVSNHETRRFH